jgi:RecA-family ATPase
MAFEYLVDQLLPTKEVHLLAGPSGSGKTRWLFQTILDWQAGISILGKKSYPCPWIYIASDRSRVSVLRTLDGMGIPSDLIPMVNAWDDNLSLGAILDAIEVSKAGFAIIESFGSFVEQPTGRCVKDLLQRCRRFMNLANCTILGVMESPKLKPHERYENPRMRVSGAAAWAHFSETIFLIEPANPKTVSDPYRLLNVCPRNGPGIVVNLCFDQNGFLHPAKLIDMIDGK